VKNKKTTVARWIALTNGALTCSLCSIANAAPEKKSPESIPAGQIAKRDSRPLSPSYVKRKHAATILAISGKVQLRRTDSLDFVDVPLGSMLFEGDRLFTGADSWAILESNSLYGRSAISLGAFQVFTVNPNLLPSSLAGPRMQPNPFDALTAKKNLKPGATNDALDWISGLFDVRSIPVEAVEAVEGTNASERKEKTSNKNDTSPKIEGQRIIVEMQGIDIFFPRQSVYVSASKRNWKISIDLTQPINTQALLYVKQVVPGAQQVQGKIIEAGEQRVTIGSLEPGEYTWQIFTGDLKRRSRLGSLYVSESEEGLLPLPPRVMPGDAVIFFD
jgi:hypothetical protein